MNGLVLKRKIMRRCGVLGLGFLLGLGAVVLADWGLPSFAANLDFGVDPTGYYLQVSSLGALNAEVDPGVNSGMAAIKDTVTVKTNIKSGYKLFLSTNKTGTEGERLALKNHPESYFSGVEHSLSAPGVLAENSWGFAIKKADSTTFSANFDDNYTVPTPSVSSKWAKVPKKETPLAIAKHNTATYDPNSPSIVGKNLDLFFGMRANTLLPAGDYEAGILYSAIGNTDNSSNSTPEQNYTGTVAPHIVSNLSGGDTITISTSLYTTAELGEITVKVGKKNCTEITPSTAGGVVTMTCKTPANEEGKYNVVVAIPKYSLSLNLVEAIEYKELQTTFNSITTMQEMTAQICENETTPYVYQNGATSGAIVGTTTRTHSANRNLVPEAYLKDTRDNKTYVVRKLADGRCWMVQNLDLDLSTGTALSSSTSDVSSNWTPNNSTQNSAGTSWGEDSNPTNQAHSYNPGDKYLTGTGDADQTVGNSGPKTAHVGNLYNWYAATAGSGTYNMSTTGQEAPHSICPKGWKLPYGNNSEDQTEDYGDFRDFRKLANTYGITSGSSTGNSDSRLLSVPLSFVRSGYYVYINGYYNDQGSDGRFWTSSVQDQYGAHNLAFDSSYVNPQHGSYKGYGFPVRCVARDPKLDDRRTIFDISNMQDMTSKICENTTTPVASATTSTTSLSTSTTRVPERELRDVRDNKTYVIRKLADGRCWMVQNLDLDLSTGTALTPATSDVSSNWTPQNSTHSNTDVVWGDNNEQASAQARSYNPGDKYLTGTGSASQTVSDSGPKTAHVGNLYNWYAATAGSGTYSMSTTGQEAPHSICPKGWKLPYGNNSTSQTENYGDFRKLTNTHGITSGAGNGGSDNRLLSAPLSFVRSGFYYYSNGSYDYHGLVGYFWSSSVYNQNTAHYLNFTSSYVNPQNYSSKGYGFSVRCLAR